MIRAEGPVGSKESVELWARRREDFRLKDAQATSLKALYQFLCPLKAARMKAKVKKTSIQTPMCTLQTADSCTVVHLAHRIIIDIGINA